MESEKNDILEAYYIKITKTLIIIAILSIIFGFVVIPMSKFWGYFEQIPWKHTLLFDIFVIIPELIIYIKCYRCIVFNGRLNKKVFKQVKIIMGIVLLINYYGGMILQPSGEWWAMAFYMAVYASFFIDIKFTVIMNTTLTLSMVIGCFIQPMGMPDKEYFLQDVLLRGSITALTMIGVTIMVYFISKVLVNIKIEKDRCKEEYFAKIEENQKQLREFKHNINNQILVLKSIVNDNNVHEANKIMNSMINETEVLYDGIYTENVVINSIINSKIGMGIEYNIKWDIHVDIPKDIDFDVNDMGIALGNILDNAVEACSIMSETEKLIYLKIYNEKRKMIIFVKNTKKNIAITKSTWKDNELDHGIGLKSVKKVIKKYNGFMENIDKGGYYEVKIILWNI